MKQNQVKIGGTYFAKVTNKRCEVRIEAENPHGGWDATNLATSKKIRIKTAARLQPAGKTKSAKKSETVTEGKTKAAKKTKKTDAEPERLSALDAAAKVLAETNEPMTSQEMITAMTEKNYWTSPGGNLSQDTIHLVILKQHRATSNQCILDALTAGKFITNTTSQTDFVENARIDFTRKFLARSAAGQC